MIVAQSRQALYLALLLACLFSAGVSARPEMHRYDQMEQQGEVSGDPRDPFGSQFGKGSGQSPHWTQMIANYKDELFEQVGFNKLYDDLGEVYSMVSRSPDYVNKLRKMHSERGAFRSGEGTPDQVHERIKVFEETKRMEALEDSKEIITDARLADKQFAFFQSLQKAKKGAKQNDELDLAKAGSVIKRGAVLNSSSSSARARNEGSVRLLAGVNDHELQINKLEEPYPQSCQNHGQLSQQTQRYYMCRELYPADEAVGEPFRVNKETYLTLLQNYTEEYSCFNKNVTRNVCVCPKGFSDFECSTTQYKKCYINITDPALYEGCSDRPDTPYYLYSVPGYDPCFFLDFSRSYEVRYQINCRQVDENGIVDAPQAQTGYEYRDVVISPSYNPFSYVSTNPETEFSVLDTDQVIVSFEFRDWKYLSNVKKTQVTVSDPEILTGVKEGTIELDFSKLEESDATGETWFVVGGRTYFEANLFGYHTSSFTTKGFFDKEGYEEPVAQQSAFRSAWKAWMGFNGFLLLIGLLVILFFASRCLCKASSKNAAVRESLVSNKAHTD